MDSFEKIYKIRVHPCESVSNLKFARLQMIIQIADLFGAMVDQLVRDELELNEKEGVFIVYGYVTNTGNP
jgi:hypothetical protein